LDAASDHRAILEIQGKTPKTQVGYKYLPQGCQRNVELYATTEHPSRKFFSGPGLMRNLTILVITYKSAARFPEVVLGGADAEK